MGCKRKILLTGFVSVTAAMTLVAGFPHFECRCVNGHVKPFCLDFGSPTSGCCGAACCSASPEESSSGSQHHRASRVPKKCCCCQHEEKQPVKASPDHSQFRRPCCVKTAAPVKTWTSSDARVKIAKDLAVQILDIPVACGLMPLPQTFGQRPSWEVRDVGPPTDLLILLQHYLI